jgi:hypothetical protein
MWKATARLLFEQIVAMDLEGIVCKRKDLGTSILADGFDRYSDSAANKLQFRILTEPLFVLRSPYRK